MKELLILFFIVGFSFLNAQTDKLIGVWNTIEVSDDIFIMNENKEMTLKKKGRKIYKSADKVSEELLIKYSDNQFIFREDNSFSVLLNQASGLTVFQGNYRVDEENKIIYFELKNNSYPDVEKYFIYSFENKYLNLEVHFGGEPTRYKLEKK
ncbi:MAG: hypothetical protein WBA59_02975 [Moheibacter sp.]